jgi:hypothetical protein
MSEFTPYEVSAWQIGMAPHTYIAWNGIEYSDLASLSVGFSPGAALNQDEIRGRFSTHLQRFIAQTRNEISRTRLAARFEGGDRFAGFRALNGGIQLLSWSASADYSFLEQSPHLLKALSLFLHGEEQLSARMLFALTSFGATLDEKSVLYSLAHAWVWNLFETAVLAHNAGDDVRALRYLRLLDVAAATLGERLTALGVKAQDPLHESEPVTPYPHFRFLGQLPEFRKDQERRATVLRAPITEERLKTIADQRERVALLITYLDDAKLDKAVFCGWPGGCHGESIVTDALVQEGSAALPALLEASRSDPRLTRYYWMGRPFWHQRHIGTVQEVARQTIKRIQGAAMADIQRDGSRWVDAKPSQGEMDKYSAPSRIDKQLLVLADDSLDLRRWAEASVEINRGSPMKLTAPLQQSSAPMLTSEQREKAGRLIERRIREGFIGSATARDEHFALTHATSMTVEFCRLNNGKCADLVAAIGEWVAANFQSFNEQRYRSLREQSLREIVQLLPLARAEDNSKFFKAYGEIVRRATPDDLSFDLVLFLSPLWSQPGWHGQLEARKELFEVPTSPWAELLGARGGQYLTSEIYFTPLLNTAEFQQFLSRALFDSRELGRLSLKGPTTIFLGIKTPGSGGRWGSYLEGQDPALLAAVEKSAPAGLAYSVGDYVAYRLSEIPGMPAFSLHWSEVQKSDAKRAGLELLRSKLGKIRFARRKGAVLLPSDTPFPPADRWSDRFVGKHVLLN